MHLVHTTVKDGPQSPIKIQDGSVVSESPNPDVLSSKPTSKQLVVPESFKEKQTKYTEDDVGDSVSRKLAPDTKLCKENNGHSCPECGKIYMHYASLHRHRKKVNNHNEGQIKCIEKGCEFTCYFLHQIRHHLSSVHEVTIEKEMLTFESYKGISKLQLE